MMNGAADAEGLCARNRRDRGDARARCRRHHPGQGSLRIFLLLRRQPHQFASGPVHNPAAGAAISAGGSSSGSAALVASGRGRHGAGRRPGRLDPHARRVLRHLRHEADARAGAVHRHHADRADTRPHRPDDRDRRGQRAAAGGAGRAGRPGSAPVRRPVRCRIGRRWAAAPRACGWRSIDEGFGWPQSLAASDLPSCARRPTGCAGSGATVETVSIPLHRLGEAIWLPIAAEGATVQMMLGNGFGFNWQGLYVTSLLDAHSAWRTRADTLSDTLKNTMLLGHFMTTPSPRPLLCQGAEPGAAAARGLRCGAGQNMTSC